MCVIAVCKDRLPTKEELEQMEAANDDGAGVAWREGTQVRWLKGLTAARIEMLRGYLSDKLPVVIHFRIATAGGVKRKLCHPFPIDSVPSEALKGTADAVLFHNGHWSDVPLMLRALKMTGDDSWRHLKSGDWSDSRQLAALQSAYKIIEDPEWVGGQRLVKFTADSLDTYGDWQEHDGLTCSNLGWIGYKKWEWSKWSGHQDLDDWGGWDGVRPQADGKPYGAISPTAHGQQAYSAGQWWYWDAHRKVYVIDEAELSQVVEGPGEDDEDEPLSVRVSAANLEDGFGTTHDWNTVKAYFSLTDADMVDSFGPPPHIDEVQPGMSRGKCRL